jgi:hypothetical protein
VTLETNATSGAPAQQTADRSGPQTPAETGTAPPGAAPPQGAAPSSHAGAAPPRPGGMRVGGVTVPPPSGWRRAFHRRFRMPGTADPRVRLRRLALVAVWATLLGFGGLVAGARLLIGLFTRMPDWYLPTICGLGVFGVACTVGAMASVHRKRTPWILLVVATATLVAALMV